MIVEPILLRSGLTLSIGFNYLLYRPVYHHRLSAYCTQLALVAEKSDRNFIKTTFFSSGQMIKNKMMAISNEHLHRYSCFHGDERPGNCTETSPVGNRNNSTLNNKWLGERRIEILPRSTFYIRFKIGEIWKFY